MPRPRSTSRRTALALGAIVLGVACGRAARGPEPLAPAGTARDDGSGLLAALSSGPAPASGAADAGPVGGATYAYRQEAGGAAYGGVGGARYAGYSFNPSVVPRPAPAAFAGTYDVVNVEDGGRIEGVVTWPGAPARAAIGEAGCEPTAVEHDGRVVGAVVYLRSIARGRGALARTSRSSTNRLQLGGALESGPCGLTPRVQLIAPVGALLSIANRERVARRLVATGEDGAATGFEVDLAASGWHDRALEQDGWLRIRRVDDARLDAWLIVEPHPYHAMTDERGGFRLDEVPPGTYELVAWYPPVLLGEDAGGVTRWTGPATRRQRVVVRARQATRASLELAAAPAR